jgi:hypothetical protein
MRFIVLALVLASCGPPPPAMPPPDGPGNCASATENLKKLGGCGEDMTTFESNCNDAANAEQSLGVRLPVGCLSNSTTCEETARCE